MFLAHEESALTRAQIYRILYYWNKDEKLSISQIIKKGTNRRLINLLLIFENHFLAVN
jgi:hypothetical protein